MPPETRSSTKPGERERARLQKALEALGVESAADAALLLERHISEIKKWNSACKLVAKGEDLLERHVLDSLAALPVLRELNPETLADAGSGAGFPGIPLAVCLPQCEVTLIEKKGRRAGFLRNAAAILGLKNLHVVEAPIEELKEQDYSFDVITFRAWKAVDSSLLALLRPLLAPSGWIAAYKGRRGQAEEELKDLESASAVSRLVPLEPSSGRTERHLLLIQPV